jgi:hypothetical protein
MAQYEGSYQGQRAQSGEGDVSGWAVGFAFFASMMLMLIGSFHVVSGFVALIDDSFYVVRPGYDISLDVTAWGWLHVIGGIVMIAAGLGVLTGALWARIIGIAVAVVSAIGSFYSIPYYPVWSILIIALDVAVIWALTVHGRDMQLE